MKLASQKHWAVEEYEKVFRQTPTCFQQDLIEAEVTNLPKWKRTITFWASNDYRPQSVGKMLDYYRELGGFTQTEPVSVYGDCSVCANTRRKFPEVTDWRDPRFMEECGKCPMQEAA